MAIPHAEPGQPLSIHPAAGAPAPQQTTTLIKTDAIEVLRVVMSKGKQLTRHKVPGEIMLQCLSGSATLYFGERECELSPGILTYLSGGQEHSLTANTDSALLLTIVLGRPTE
jgi:quercetin dioxygenase-like cupin family protein